MSKYLFIFSLFILGLSSCKKSTDNTAIQAAADDAAIQAYISANYSTTPFTKDASGLYYAVTTPGTGAYPTATSNVSISYTGKLFDGTVFETGPSTAFALPNTTMAWQIGIPHINKGGTIILISPSALAYGVAGTGSVPANTPVTWTIGLQGFN